MQTEDNYQDLTDLFADQDEALQSDAFVDTVMSRVEKRSRWRIPLLFGATGFGLGAALSQIGGLLNVIAARSPQIDVSIDTLQSAQFDLQTPATWIIGAVVVIASCAAILVTERV